MRKDMYDQENIRGLTEQEAAVQERRGNVNVMPEHSGKSVKQIIRGNVVTYFNAIFCIIAVLLIIAGSYNSLTFIPLVAANTVIGIIQQLQAKKVLDKLSLLDVASYRVRREGKEREIPSDRLVLGDVIRLEGGQQIPADAEVLSGRVMVNESLLTGEADEVEKTEGAKLMSGSFVVSGVCYAELICVGAHSYAARLTAKAKVIREKPSQMIFDIDLIVKIAGILIIPIGIALFYQGMFVNGNTFSEAVVSMVGAVIGMIPEGLYLLVTVALALSAMRLGQRHVLLHDMRSTEALARVDVLCVDKTGTLTDNKMQITAVLAPVGTDEKARMNAEEILGAYVHTVRDSNSTAKALCAYYKEGRLLSAVSVKPFSSKEKFSEIATDAEIYRLGAPEFLLNDATLEENQDILREHLEKGERLLAFVSVRGDTVKPLLFVCLVNGLRPHVKETVAYLTAQEMMVKVISGDNPLTVSRIAAMVGIPNADRYVDATTLKSKQDYAEAVRNYTVFGRVKPEQKKNLVVALRKSGQKVAMTGDGVNDILAMKEADCSIAMGAGSDAARQAAQVVLLDSDFSHMREIIGEGRRNINNITPSATLFLYKNIFSMLLAVFSIINTFTYPLQPTQVSLISMFNIGVPAFLLAFESSERKQNIRFLLDVLLRSLPAALTSFFSIAAMVVLGNVFNLPAEDVSVASTFLLSVVGFLILYRICEPLNKYRACVLFGCIAAMIFFAVFFNDLFAISGISARCALLAAVFAFEEESVMRHLTKWFEFLRRRAVKKHV
ncbi:MAG: HAD-IC family P-type ATPase [Clostridiales bacterium]|nr:HAD-IC family P-type ATPase [Clostridiales bacterium]